MYLNLSRVKKVICSIFLFFSIGLLLTGCWDSKELNDLSIIVGAAIDKHKDKKIELTVQIFSPLASSGQQGSSIGGSGGSQPQVAVSSAIGDNFADATLKLQEKLPRKIFWGHCKVFIIGEKLARKRDLQTQIDFLNRHPEPRERAHLYVSDGKAADILALNSPLEKNIGVVLQKLSQMRLTQDITIKDFEQMSIGDSGGAVLPIVVKLPQKQGEKKSESITYITGTAIFKKYKMISRINDSASRGLLWVRNQIDVPTITAHPIKGKTISLDSIRESTKLIPKIEKGKWSITVHIESDGMIVQNGSELDIMNKKVSRRVEKAFEAEIKKSINQALKQVKDKKRIDAFGFGDAFHRKYPKEWEKVKNNWESFLPRVNVKTNIKVHIRETGLNTTAVDQLDKEVKK
ncbi:Ger(x)C family spore germination protein [Peribacillus sp. B-H-3]|uniref:Ger(x)C family spore germination protein n=1 Tax=Peribacillus sp. B-H-3 TaxID=3400420 RepID=UPI003B01418E